jgi:hypothetical protein
MIQDPTKKWMRGKTSMEIKAIEVESKKTGKEPSEVIKTAEWKKHLPPPPKPKYHFDVKIETMLPATLTWRVLAETPEQAAEMIKGLQPTGVKHRLIGRKDLKLLVYNAGSSLIKFVKNLGK